MKKKIALGLAAIAALSSLTACNDDSDVVDHNITKAAKNFEIQRRIVVVNGITNDYIMNVEGRCNVDPSADRIWITCKVADGNGVDSYKRSQIYRSDNVFVTVEQMEPIAASAYHYRRTFKPQQVIPDIDFRGSMGDHPQTQN